MYLYITQESRIGCQYSTLGDGNCDDENNNAECNYDGGDCNGPQLKKSLCSKCECFDHDCSQLQCECLDPCNE